MTFTEFKQYVTEMQNFYGQTLSDTEIEKWFGNLGFMSIERFNYILEQIYRNNKFIPKLSEILEVHNSIPYEEKKIEVKGNCDKCDNTGYLLYTKMINNRPYTYACVCDCGRQQRYDGTKIKDLKHRNKSYIPTVQELGIQIKANKTITPQQIVKAMNFLNKTNIVSEKIKEILRRKYVEMTRK